MNTISPNPSLLAPSILSADFSRLADHVSLAVNAGADLIHVDVMDGHFVPNLSIGTPIVASLLKAGFGNLDVHLMVNKPEKMIPWFLKRGVERVSFHVEAAADAKAAVAAIRASGAQTGLAISPPTDLDRIRPLLSAVDFILVMSVNPGFGTQAFLPEAVDRVRQVRRWLADAGLRSRIEVDGGIRPDTARQMRDAGADIFVAGHSVFSAPDIPAAVHALRAAVQP